VADVLTEALNAPAGRLAEVLLKKLGSGSDNEPEMLQRLDRLVDAPGRAGFLARIRLATEVSLLFDRAPIWTRRRIVPLFEWTSADAQAAWAARKYSGYIGSPELFSLTKRPFLEMFTRSDVAAEDLRTYAEWLVAIFIAHQEGSQYPLKATEARSALRRAGDRILPSVGHRLAMEMEKAKQSEKALRWQSVVGPAFQAIWPLDIELQTSASTFKLTQILRAAGDAFPAAADVIIPFIRPEDPKSHSTVFSIAEAPDSLYASAPGKMLNLLSAVVGDAATGSVHSLGKALDRVSAHDSTLAGSAEFRKLRIRAAT